MWKEDTVLPPIKPRRSERMYGGVDVTLGLRSWASSHRGVHCKRRPLLSLEAQRVSTDRSQGEDCRQANISRRRGNRGRRWRLIDLGIAQIFLRALRALIVLLKNERAKAKRNLVINQEGISSDLAHFILRFPVARRPFTH